MDATKIPKQENTKEYRAPSCNKTALLTQKFSKCPFQSVKLKRHDLSVSILFILNSYLHIAL